MNFSKLFGKKGGDKKAPKQDKNEQTQLMLDQKIKEQELRISNIETRTNALQEEAKAKLKAGDKAGAKISTKDMEEWPGDRFMGVGIKKMKGYKCNLCIDELKEDIISKEKYLLIK